VLRIHYRNHLQSLVIQNLTKLTATTFNACKSVYVQNSKLYVNSHYHFDVCRKTSNLKANAALMFSGFCSVCLKPNMQIHSSDFIKQIFRNVQIICYQYISKSLILVALDKEIRKGLHQLHDVKYRVFNLKVDRQLCREYFTSDAIYNGSVGMTLYYYMCRSWQDCCRRGENRSWPSVSAESVDSECWCLNNANFYTFVMRLTVVEHVFILESYLKTMSYAHCRQVSLKNLEGKRQ